MDTAVPLHVLPLLVQTKPGTAKKKKCLAEKAILYQAKSIQAFRDPRLFWRASTIQASIRFFP